MFFLYYLDAGNAQFNNRLRNSGARTSTPGGYLRCTDRTIRINIQYCHPFARSISFYTCTHNKCTDEFPWIYNILLSRSVFGVLQFVRGVGGFRVFKKHNQSQTDIVLENGYNLLISSNNLSVSLKIICPNVVSPQNVFKYLN